ncbi:hypothetical protein D3C81_1926220 [compost metagenome]
MGIFLWGIYCFPSFVCGFYFNFRVCVPVFVWVNIEGLSFFEFDESVFVLSVALG